MGLFSCFSCAKADAFKEPSAAALAKDANPPTCPAGKDAHAAPKEPHSSENSLSSSGRLTRADAPASPPASSTDGYVQEHRLSAAGGTVTAAADAPAADGQQTSLPILVQGKELVVESSPRDASDVRSPRVTAGDSGSLPQQGSITRASPHTSRVSCHGQPPVTVNAVAAATPAVGSPQLAPAALPPRTSLKAKSGAADSSVGTKPGVNPSPTATAKVSPRDLTSKAEAIPAAATASPIPKTPTPPVKPSPRATSADAHRAADRAAASAAAVSPRPAFLQKSASVSVNEKLTTPVNNSTPVKRSPMRSPSLGATPAADSAKPSPPPRSASIATAKSSPTKPVWSSSTRVPTPKPVVSLLAEPAADSAAEAPAAASLDLTLMTLHDGTPTTTDITTTTTTTTTTTPTTDTTTAAVDGLAAPHTKRTTLLAGPQPSAEPERATKMQRTVRNDFEDKNTLTRSAALRTFLPDADEKGDSKKKAGKGKPRFKKTSNGKKRV